MYCSDVHSIAIENTKKNFIRNGLKADIKKGHLFEPWSEKKFDYIIQKQANHLINEINNSDEFENKIIG